MAGWPYTSSIMVKNKDVPLFEDPKHDYPWLLKVTENRACKEIDPCVIRYVDGNNLSLDPQYRQEDFDLIYDVLLSERNLPAIAKLCATRAKYFYKVGNYSEARGYFRRADQTLKNRMYILTSYCPPLARWIVRKFTVFG